MKLAEINFDWSPVIPGADPRGEGLLFPLRGTSCFKAAEGWSIEVLDGGRFRLYREGMPAPVVVGDGYSYVEAPVMRSVPDDAGLLSMAAQARLTPEQAAMQERAVQARVQRRKK